MGNEKIEYCPPLFSGILLPCQKEQCQLWESDRNKCLAKSFLGGYLKQQIATQRMMGLYDSIQNKIDKDEEF
jgi:hypothetical protein